MQANFIIKNNFLLCLEKEKSITKKRSAKSISSDEEEPGDERPSTSKSKSTKRKKRSNY
jgi:hypothetical protein